MPKRQTSSTLPRQSARPPAPQRPTAAPVEDGAIAVQRVADGVVEAACLVALLAIPLYFSVLTSTGYEPDKAILIRVFAAIAAGAWLAATIVRPRATLRLTRNPILLTGSVLFLAYLIASLLSIDPRVSLWGSQGRQEGLWSWAAYFVFFIAAATRLRSVQQWERLVTVFVFGSVPIVVYGFFQQFGFDPIPTTGDPTTLAWPVRSTLGQHVFLGAYLVMVIPFTAARLAEHLLRPKPVPKGRGDEVLLLIGAALATAITFYIFMGLGFHRPALFTLFPLLLAGYAMVAVLLHAMSDTVGARQARLAGYTGLLGLQIIVLVFTGARGPWLGFFASIPVFAFLVARRLGRPQIARTIIGVAAAVALFVGVLNIPGGPLQPLRGVHALSRVANITSGDGTDGSAQGRLLIWQGVRNLMVDTPSVGGTWGGHLRDLVGYGPETMHWAFEAVYPRLLRQATSENWVWDRAHDIYLDRLVDAGVFGLLAFLALVALVFWRSVAWLNRLSGPAAWITVGAAAAVAGHLVEGFFGLETAVTLLPLWVIFGFAARLPFGGETADVPVSAASMATPSAVYWGALAVAAALVAAISPSIEGSPAFLSALLLLSVALGVGAMATVLGAERGGPRPVRSAKQAAPVRLPASTLVWLGLLGLATAVALGSQMQFETAAFAERAGQTQLGQGNITGAIGYLQEAVRTNAYEVIYVTELGAAYLDLGQNHLDSGLPSFQPSLHAALTMDPQQALNLGKDQLYGLALDSLQHARSLAPLDPDTDNNVGNLLLQWNKPAQALPAFVRAEQLSHQNPRYLDQEALAYLQLGKLTIARGRAEAAYRLDPTFWFTYYALAFADHQRGAHALARQEAATALVLEHNAYPGPPQSQLTELQSIQKSG